MIRAVRGATTASRNTKHEIFIATKELLSAMIEENKIRQDDMICMIFSMSQDLDAVFPAAAAREAGYTDVPLMCFSEINVQGSIDKCIRIMIQFNTDKNNSDLKHIYLKEAKILRPDISGGSLDEKD